MAKPWPAASLPAASSPSTALSPILLQFTGAPLEDALPLLTANPAAMTGLEEHAGSIAVGRPANLVALDPSGNLLASIQNGQLAAQA